MCPARPSNQTGNCNLELQNPERNRARNAQKGRYEAYDGRNGTVQPRPAYWHRALVGHASRFAH